MDKDLGSFSWIMGQKNVVFSIVVLVKVEV